MHAVRPVLKFLVILLFCIPTTCAGQDDCLRRKVPLTVVDPRGRTIQDLTAADFQAKYRGKPIQIVSLVPDNRPRRIVLLLDASASMGQTWNVARLVAEDILDSQLPNTSFVFLVFSNRVIDQVGFDQGTEAIRRLLQGMGEDLRRSTTLIRGHTAIYDSILTALRMLGPADSADSLYLISDGGENASHASSKEVLRALISSGVRLHFIFLDKSFRYRPTPEELYGPRDIGDLVKGTGGLSVESGYLIANSSQSSQEQKAMLSTNLARMYARILHSWRIEILLPEGDDKLREWELQFSSEKKHEFKDAKLIFPHQLASCSSIRKNSNN
jgi:hypothetical protein